MKPRMPVKIICAAIAETKRPVSLLSMPKPWRLKIFSMGEARSRISRREPVARPALRSREASCEVGAFGAHDEQRAGGARPHRYGDGQRNHSYVRPGVLDLAFRSHAGHQRDGRQEEQASRADPERVEAYPQQFEDQVSEEESVTQAISGAIPI
jgi:hypothetical protein